MMTKRPPKTIDWAIIFGTANDVMQDGALLEVTEAALGAGAVAEPPLKRAEKARAG